MHGILQLKMNEFIHHPENMRIFGDSAYHTIKKYSIENQVQQIIDLYNRIPGKKSEISGFPPMIVCHGNHFDPACATALALLSKHCSPRKILFLMSDWLYDDQIRRGALLWIVNDSEDISAVHFCLRYGLPLLVPEKKQDIKEFCENLHCCVLYRNCLDVEPVIHFILHNEKEWMTMIKRGTKFRSLFPGTS